jgi:galactokinase
VKIEALCELTPADWQKYSSFVKDPVLNKRARHCIAENQRVKDAANVLKEGNLVELGQLLNASHKSLKEDYEVTGIELDTLAETAQKQEGCLGARMTGAGFGGCAIALVHKDKIDNFITKVQSTYEKAIGYKAGFFVCETGDGVRGL